MTTTTTTLFNTNHENDMNDQTPNAEQFAQDVAAAASTEQQIVAEAGAALQQKAEVAAQAPPEEITPEELAEHSTEALLDDFETKTTGMSLKVHKWGQTLNVSAEAKKEMADTQGASEKSVVAKKLLIEKSKQPKEMKEVLRQLSQIRQLWILWTMPSTEDGVRIIRLDQAQKFNDEMAKRKDALRLAIDALAAKREDIKAQAKTDLDQLYNPADYQVDFHDVYSFSWQTKNLLPDERLKQVSPELYKAEAAAVRGQLAKAADKCEEELTTALSYAVNMMVENLNATDDDGKKKNFKPSSLTRLEKFFADFKQFSLGGSNALNKIVEEAQLAIKGMDPKDVKKDIHLQDTLKDSMESLQSKLGGMMETKKKRKLTY